MLPELNILSMNCQYSITTLWAIERYQKRMVYIVLILLIWQALDKWTETMLIGLVNVDVAKYHRWAFIIHLISSHWIDYTGLICNLIQRKRTRFGKAMWLRSKRKPIFQSAANTNMSSNIQHELELTVNFNIIYVISWGYFCVSNVLLKLRNTF